MQNKNKIIKEVAEELGIPNKVVQEVVVSQLSLARKVIKENQNASIYIRKVGYFLGYEAKRLIKKQQYKFAINKRDTKNKVDEDPIEFN